MSVHEMLHGFCLVHCPFFSKLHKQSRLTLVPSFFLERSGVDVSICGNDASKVLADWLISKKAARTYEKHRYEGNQGGRSREQIFVRVRTLFGRFLYTYLICSKTKNSVRFHVSVRALYKRILRATCNILFYALNPNPGAFENI